MYTEHARIEAQINLKACAQNILNMKENLSPETKMILVVKTNAYGHGAVPIAKMAEPLDYIWGFAVATAEEGLQLREAGIRKPILILGFVFPGHYEMLVEHEMRPAVFKEDMAKALDLAAERAGKVLPVHLAVDTGMTRIGLSADEEGADTAAAIDRLPHLRTEGLFTHYARADEEDKSSAHEQFAAYQRFVSYLEERGVSIPMKHTANSAAIAELPGFQLDAVRAGITLYGIYPSDEVKRDSIRLHPVMSLISHISYIKTVPAGTPVSYGGTYVTKRETRIATVPAGYGDGYPRLLSNKGSVLIRGKRAPIIGRVCMDQFMVDVTDIEAEEFDPVTLLGRDGDDQITVDELGRLSGRFPYEFTCNINQRVPRVYYE